MNIQLFEGEFSSSDAIELITQMMHIKIKFHESKIGKSEIEEDIKAREVKIKRLQSQVGDLRNMISDVDKSIKLNAIININE